MARDGLFIGEVAKESGVPQKTIRYYEDVGLLKRPQRSETNYRLYSSETIGRLRFIKKAQAFGLSLREIQGIMECSEEGLKPCCDLVRTLFTKKIDEFQSQINELSRMKRGLEKLLSEWVSPSEVKKRSFAVCPQIEKEPKRKSLKL